MISGVILASGFSRRMRQDKLLLEVEGMPLVERVIRAANTSGLDECILIFRDPAVQAIGERYGLKTIHNFLAHEGQSAAVRLGVRHASEKASGYLFMVGDQPFLTSGVINCFIENHKKQPGKIHTASYCGERGNPVLFPRMLRTALERLNGDAGGRQIIQRMPEGVVEVTFDDRQYGIDIDTPETYRRFADKVRNSE